MKNEVAQNLQKLQTLLHYIGHPIRTEGEIRVRVNRALGPAEMSGSSVSVFEDPEASIKETWESALDRELESSMREFESLKDPAGRIAPKTFSALGSDAFATLDKIQETVITSETLTPPALKILNQIQKDLELAATVIGTAQQEHSRQVTQAIMRNPAQVVMFAEPVELPAESQVYGSASPAPVGKPHDMTAADYVRLAIEPYLPAAARHSSIDPGQAAVGRSGQPLTTRQADLQHDPVSGVNAIRALDTYFTLAFPQSPLKTVEERVETLLRYAVGMEQTYRTELAQTVQAASRVGTQQHGLNQKAANAIRQGDAAQLVELLQAGMKPNAQTTTGILTRLNPDQFRQVVTAGFDVKANSNLVFHQLGKSMETGDSDYKKERLEILEEALKAGADPAAMPRDIGSTEFKAVVRNFKNGPAKAPQPPAPQEPVMVR